MVKTVIVGTGDMAYGLAHLFRNNNCFFTGNDLVITKPGIADEGTFHDTEVPLMAFDQAIIEADIVILAIPARELKKFVTTHFQSLEKKILVDITNSSNRGEDLNSFLGFTDVSWVKAFNDIGAVDVLLDKPAYKNKIITKMCSDNRMALDIVKKFAEESLGLGVKVVPYARYEEIELHQNSLGQEWCHAAYILIFIFAVSETYAILRYNVYKGYEWYHLPIQVTNKGICWTSLNGFAVAQLPGVFAHLSNAIYGDTLHTKASWLVWGLKLRKHLGLLSLWFLFVHIMMSLLIFNEKYYGKFFSDPKANSSKMNAIGESSFLFAILGTGLYAIMGLCSMPSIGSQMTNKQWKLVYGPIAWIALIFGTVHVLIMGVKGWPTTEKWPGGMPPITMTSVLLPLATLLLKEFQIIFCFFASKRSVYPSKQNSLYKSIDQTMTGMSVYSSDSGNQKSSDWDSSDIEGQSLERKRIYPSNSDKS